MYKAKAVFYTPKKAEEVYSEKNEVPEDVADLPASP